jgi:polar amino acid transport system substrate-binding protein
MAALGIAALTPGAIGGSASAQSLLEKIKNGDTIRLGFSNETADQGRVHCSGHRPRIS